MNKKLVSMLVLLSMILALFSSCAPEGENITEIAFDKTQMSMVVGEKVMIKTIISPTEEQNAKLRWTSSNPAVASVRNGMVKARSAGTTVITASSLSGKYAVCVVKVEENGKGGFFKWIGNLIESIKPSVSLTPDTYNEYALGMGVAFGEFKVGEFNATVATVVLDKDGKIVACRLDAVQNKWSANFDEDTFEFTKLDTKMELGTEYGMGQESITDANKWMDNNNDGKVLEWNEQAKAFEAWCVGKTLAEVEALGKAENLQEKNNHMITTNEELLNAGCTIQIDGFVEAVVKACKDDQGVTFKSKGKFTLGVAANSQDNGSSVAEFVATIKMNVDVAASVVEDGKIVASLNDAMQPQIVYDDEGEVTDKSVGKGAENGLKTKRELKEAYGMGQESITDKNKWMDNNNDSKVLEWYKQSAEFSKFVVGKTADEVKALETQAHGDHNISKDDALLSAGCTIDIVGIKAVVAESVTNAR